MASGPQRHRRARISTLPVASVDRQQPNSPPKPPSTLHDLDGARKAWALGPPAKVAGLSVTLPDRMRNTQRCATSRRRASRHSQAQCQYGRPSAEDYRGDPFEPLLRAPVVGLCKIPFLNAPIAAWKPQPHRLPASLPRLQGLRFCSPGRTGGLVFDAPSGWRPGPLSAAPTSRFQCLRTLLSPSRNAPGSNEDEWEPCQTQSTLAEPA